ncbi:hypothetical protein [Paucibacter soli]|uniref:hypothetical protein n=1 Tax=Paucibacter soli TaxID=3133433 RepID=UPI0030AAB6FE
MSGIDLTTTLALACERRAIHVTEEAVKKTLQRWRRRCAVAEQAGASVPSNPWPCVLPAARAGRGNQLRVDLRELEKLMRAMGRVHCVTRCLELMGELRPQMEAA